MHEVTKTTTFTAQIAKLNQMIKNMMTSLAMSVVEPVKVVTHTSEVLRWRFMRYWIELKYGQMVASWFDNSTGA